jgi:hypothetical protein
MVLHVEVRRYVGSPGGNRELCYTGGAHHRAINTEQMDVVHGDSCVVTQLDYIVFPAKGGNPRARAGKSITGNGNHALSAVFQQREYAMCVRGGSGRRSATQRVPIAAGGLCGHGLLV